MINIKKYENLGHAQRVRKDPERGETETNSSKPARTSFKKHKIDGPPIKVKVVPPDELNSDEWWKKQNPKELYEISDYDDDDDCADKDNDDHVIMDKIEKKREVKKKKEKNTNSIYHQ